MSNMLENDHHRPPFRLPPAEAQIAMGIAAMIFGFLAIQGEDFSLGPVILLTAIFVGGIWAQRVWLVWLMIGFLVYLKYLVVHPGMRLGLRGLQFNDLFNVFIMMLLVATSFRHQESARFINTFFPDTKLGQKQFPNRLQFPSLLGGRWWAMPLAIFLALVLLGLLPFERSPFFAQFRIQPVASRLIFITLLLFFTWFISNSVVGIFARWKMKPTQADVQSRSLIAKELWKDSFDIERRRSKYQAKEN